MNYEYRGAEGRSTFKTRAEEVCDSLYQETSTEQILTFHHSEDRTNLRIGLPGPIKSKQPWNSGWLFHFTALWHTDLAPEKALNIYYLYNTLNITAFMACTIHWYTIHLICWGNIQCCFKKSFEYFTKPSIALNMFEKQEGIQIYKTNKPMMHIYFMLPVRSMKSLSSSTCYTAIHL